MSIIVILMTIEGVDVLEGVATSYSHPFLHRAVRHYHHYDNP